MVKRMLVAVGLLMGAGSGCEYDSGRDQWTLKEAPADSHFTEPQSLEDRLSIQRSMRENGGKMPMDVPLR